MNTYFYILLFLSSAGALPAVAQEFRIPQPSTTQKIEQEFGLGKISITYSRPNTKGRKVFDGMEPYGKVWRTGANAATVLTLTDTVQLAGHTVLPGEYSLFTIPDKQEWTIILNKTVKQWGAYSYDSTQDVLRFKVSATKILQHVETFIIQFVNMVPDHGELHLSWEYTDIAIPLLTDMDARVMTNIDEAMKGERKPYYFAAIYYYNHNKDMNKALSWIKEFERQVPDADNAKYWKARIQLKQGDKEGAVITATEGVKLAMEGHDIEYIRLNKEVLEDARKQ